MSENENKKCPLNNFKDCIESDCMLFIPELTSRTEVKQADKKFNNKNFKLSNECAIRAIPLIYLITNIKVALK